MAFAARTGQSTLGGHTSAHLVGNNRLSEGFDGGASKWPTFPDSRTSCSHSRPEPARTFAGFQAVSWPPPSNHSSCIEQTRSLFPPSFVTVADRRRRRRTRSRNSVSRIDTSLKSLQLTRDTNSRLLRSSAEKRGVHLRRKQICMQTSAKWRTPWEAAPQDEELAIDVRNATLSLESASRDRVQVSTDSTIGRFPVVLESGWLGGVHRETLGRSRLNITA